ncbi:hypothetical protein Ga0102493_112485 [Erythrobacter litoralis]|uniref:hypothetical protein n=1 Tax=Erythrobacter litoralis TaxID=39960 RepID=UPI00086398B6|nr:hypothetical protein Ga0102493_112485 [Erythrobacter litoralis]
MRQAILGVMAGLVYAGIGVFWWQGRATIEQNAPPPPEPEEPAPYPLDLPVTNPGHMEGPEPPELTREQQRFFRYDRNRDWRITRTEMMTSHSDGFRKLDVTATIC